MLFVGVRTRLNSDGAVEHSINIGSEPCNLLHELREFRSFLNKGFL